MDSALQHSKHTKRRLEGVLKCMNDLVFFFDRNHVVVDIWVNDELQLLKPSDQMIGRTLTEIVNPEFAKPYDDCIELAFTQNKASEYEYISPTDNKIIRNAKIRKIETEIGEEELVVSVMENITEKHNYKLELKKYIELLHSIINNSLKGVYAIDFNYKIIAINEKQSEIFKIKNENEVRFGSDIFQSFKTEAQKEIYRERFERALQGEEFVVREKFTYFQNKKVEDVLSNEEDKESIYYLNQRFTPIHSNGQIIGLTVYTENITDQILNLREIENNRVQTQSIIDNTDDYIFLIDRNLKILTANEPIKTYIRKYYKLEFDDRFLISIKENYGFDRKEKFKWLNRIGLAYKGIKETYEDQINVAGEIHYLKITFAPIEIKGKIRNVAVKISDITLQKANEIKFKRLSDQLRGIIETTEDSVILTDENLDILYNNHIFDKEVRNIFDPEKKINNLLDLFKISNQGSDDSFTEYYFKALKGEKLKLIREHYYSGKYFWYETFINPIFREDKITGLAITSRNITEEKNNQIQIEESEKLMQYALEATGEGVWDWNIKTNKITNTPAWIQKMGIETVNNQKDLLQFYQRVHPDDLEGVKKAARDYFEGKVDLYEVEYRFRKNDGIIVWVSDKGKIVKWDDDGSPIRMVGAMVDVTDRKLAENQILRQSTIIETVFNNVPNLIFVKDSKKRFTLVNRAVENIYSTDFSNLVGKADQEINPDLLEVENFESVDDEVLRTKQTILVPEEPVTNPETKETKWFQTLKVPVMLENELHILGVSTDITERKKSDSERAALIDQLLKRNDEMEQFTYIVSHNLRAPVAKILGLAELYDPSEENPEINKFIYKSLLSETKTLDQIILDLNEIIAVRRQGVENKTVIDLSMIVQDVIELLSADIKMSLANIEIDFKRAPTVLGTRSYLHSIMYNLLSNAIKYRNISVPLNISLYSIEKGKNILISIQDNGIGIDLEKHGSKLFGLYRRFNSQIEGKGIGLHITKAQIEMMGGEIEVKSNLGEGSTFIIRLPLT